MLRPPLLDITWFTKVSGPNWEVTQQTERDGDRVRDRWMVRTPKGDLTETRITTYGQREFSFASWEEHLIKCERDLDLFEEFEPPLQYDLRDRARAALEAVGQDGIVAPFLPCSPFNQGFYLRGLEPILLDAKTNTTFFDRLMRFCLRQSLTLLPELAASGVDVGCVGGNVGNARLLGLKFYREHLFPYDRAYVQAIQAAGIPVLFHNCGYSMPFLEAYAELGCRAFESLTPPPNADGNLAEAKRRVGDRLVLVGNLDQINLLRHGTHAQIEEVVRATVAAGAPGGGFVLSTADHLYDETPMENIRWAVKVARDCGVY
jgi:uroporphyrinogen-III decarboxylase